MNVTYKKLWKLLIDKEMNKRELANAAGISSATLTKLAKGENVNVDILVKICATLDCRLDDIVELISAEDAASNQ